MPLDVHSLNLRLTCNKGDGLTRIKLPFISISIYRFYINLSTLHNAGGEWVPVYEPKPTAGEKQPRTPRPFDVKSLFFFFGELGISPLHIPNNGRLNMFITRQQPSHFRPSVTACLNPLDVKTNVQHCMYSSYTAFTYIYSSIQSVIHILNETQSFAHGCNAHYQESLSIGTKRLRPCSTCIFPGPVSLRILAILSFTMCSATVSEPQMPKDYCLYPLISSLISRNKANKEVGVFS